MHRLIQTHASILRCMRVFCVCLRCVSNVFVCSNLTYTQVFGQICVYFRRIHHIFKRMRLFCDVCVSFAYVCAVFQTFLCVLTLHIRRFSDKYVCISDVYIKFSTQALLYSGACIRFAMYVLLFRMFALCFKRYCVF
jgi:hypothetical protein